MNDPKNYFDLVHPGTVLRSKDTTNATTQIGQEFLTRRHRFHHPGLPFLTQSRLVDSFDTGDVIDQ